MHTAELTVVPIAWTQVDLLEMYHATIGDWELDPDEHVTPGEALVEFAGRACYQSWLKPNPATATNEGYIRHILEVGHYSVLEHGTVTFYLTGVSRSFTHELVRHRHFSYSQLSQRYVPEGAAAMVEPDVIAGDPALHKTFTEAADAAVRAYNELLAGLEAKFAGEVVPVCDECRAPVEQVNDPYGWWCSGCRVTRPAPPTSTARPTSTSLKKQARQAARSVLPNATETKIVVTGNYRAWRHFVQMRASEHADVEIRAVAVLILLALQEIAPHVFADFAVRELPDGSRVAESSFVDQS